MLVVKIEMWPHGREERAFEIGRTYIANDGAGTRERGNYKVAVCRKGTTAVPKDVYPPISDEFPDDVREKIAKAPQAARAGHVEDYPRLSYNVWRLIARALLAAFPEEDKVLRRPSTILGAAVVNGFRSLANAWEGKPDFFDRQAVTAALEWLAAATDG